MERYERLQTSADVRALSRGIGESLTLDYKEKLGRRRDLAADVCALANTQGGVLVVGVKDPEPEGSPPKDPADFKGVPVETDLVHRVESQLLDAISPRVFPRIMTTDTFPQNGDERCFLLIEVPASSQLHQVTVERDFKFYRRAEYQNRPMTTEEVQLRVEAILAGRSGTTALIEKEIARLDEIMDQSYVAFLAAPGVEHRLATDPAEPNVRREIQNLAQTRRSGVVQLVPLSSEFQPSGDGARATQQHYTGAVSMECRVRRNSLIVHAHSGGAIEGRTTLVTRTSPAGELWRELEDPSAVDSHFAPQSSESGRPSIVVDPATAARLYPDALREKAEAFLDLIRGVYDLGGWRGSIRLDVAVVGKRAFPAVSTNTMQLSDFLALSEGTTLQASIEFDYESLELRGGDLIEELMRRVGHNFGMDRLPD